MVNEITIEIPFGNSGERGVGGQYSFKYILDTATEDLIYLHNDANMTTGGHTMNHNNADYQVTGGKTFTLLGVLTDGDLVLNTLKIFQNDTADSNATIVEKFSWASPLITGSEEWKDWIPVVGKPTFAANKFVNCSSTSTSNTGQIFAAIGFES